MMTSDKTGRSTHFMEGAVRLPETGKFSSLVRDNLISEAQLRSAEVTAIARGVPIELVLQREQNVSRDALLAALSDHYHCPYAEYDERIPVPPDLLLGLDGERLSMGQWFPIMRHGDTVIVISTNPADPSVREEAKGLIRSEKFEFWVAFPDDIQWFIQDFLHAKPGSLIGTERTGLAYWRNTMAQWRTRLACYRTDLAKARTDLAFLRWGLGFIAIAETLLRTGRIGIATSLLIASAGTCLLAYGIVSYLKIRKQRMGLPGHHTLVEVTSATICFLDNYHFLDDISISAPTKPTMLGRLVDFLSTHCTILYPSPSSRERTQLARERNVLAAQRTIAACYRTLYSRGRTGLAFIRSGVAFLSLGLGLLQYFSFGMVSVIDGLLALAGVLLITDGIMWYWPVRKEQSEALRCPLPK